MSRGQWQTRELASEALRNVLASPVRLTLNVVLFASVFGGVAGLELVYSSAVLSTQRELNVRGANVVVLTAEDGASAARCDALRAVDGVLEAGALRMTAVDALQADPENRVQTAAATAGLVRIWNPELVYFATGWLAGQALARELAVGEGAFIGLMDARPAAIGGIIDGRARSPAIDRWLVSVVAPTGTSSECWVEFVAGAVHTAPGLLNAWFEGEASAVQLRPLLPLNEFSTDPARQLRERPQADAWLPIGIVMAAMAWLITWLRRAETTLYRGLDTRAIEVLLMTAVEWAVVVAISWALGVAWATAVTVTIHGSIGVDQLQIALRSSGSAAAITMALAAFAALPILRSSVVELLKDR